MPKYSLFIQRRERISGSRIAKRDPDLIVHDPRSTGNNYFCDLKFFSGTDNQCGALEWKTQDTLFKNCTICKAICLRILTVRLWILEHVMLPVLRCFSSYFFAMVFTLCVVYKSLHIAHVTSLFVFFISLICISTRSKWFAFS